MKALLSLNLLLASIAIIRTDDCGLRALTAGVELYRDFDALHTRACRDLRLNLDMYLVMRKKCVHNLIAQFDYEDELTDLAYEFWQMDCYKMSTVHNCSDQEYSKLKHCAFDFWMQHLDDGLRIYKNHTLLVQIYSYAIKAKDCLTKSLDEIEANHSANEIHEV